jgi:serine/threonine protein phosphatase 1
VRVYAIGDIHGQLDMLRAAHDRVAADRGRTGDTTAPLIHLGDLCDRGPDTRGVIDLILAGLDRGEPWQVLKGNHDRMFTLFVRHGRQDPGLRADLTWFDHRLGGAETLASYGVDVHGSRLPAVQEAATRAVPARHLDFLERLPLSFRTPDLFLAHAGVRAGVPLDRQVEDDLVWIRGAFLTDRTTDYGALVVHGHTVVPAPTHYGNRVALDTGAGYGDPLTAAVFEGRRAYVLTDTGREPLDPLP